MSTTLAKKETVSRKWYVLDAAGKPLGRTAATAAVLLRGKHKPDYTPNVDCGDFGVIINAGQAVLTGNKLQQKYSRRHSGWIGGLKEVKYDRLMSERPELAMELAVKGMMAKNTLGKNAMGRLHVYAGAEHKHEAQKPEAWTQE
ncbi:MAG: 50S ribosomal protein L13 [Oscillospiraceae bacterium]|nr:50S ribosomal protein L13 [Oscillospiraceae bacterium]